MSLQESLDRVDQCGDTAKDATALRLCGECGEETLNQVQPGRRGRGEVAMEARMLGKPLLNLGCLMSSMSSCRAS